MMRLAMLANLITWSLVVSQPLFYGVALTDAQRALSAPAYVELRQRINAVMSRRVAWIHLAALATSVVLLALAWRAPDSVVAITTGVAIVCLLADAVLMIRENVPINGVIDGWTTARIPDDWETFRNRWFAIFGVRQGIVLVGFLSVLVGAVFRA